MGGRTITEKSVSAIKPGGRFTCCRLPGFGVRCTPKRGKVVFFARVGSRVVTIGEWAPNSPKHTTVKMARARAREILSNLQPGHTAARQPASQGGPIALQSEEWRALVQEVVVSCGGAPAKQPLDTSSDGLTVGELLERLREEYFCDKHAKTVRAYSYSLHKHVSQWRDKPVSELTDEVIEQWHRQGQRDHAWKALKGFLKLAKKRKLISRVPQPDLKTKKRSRKDFQRKALERRDVETLTGWLEDRMRAGDSWLPSAIFALLFILNTGERSEAARTLRPCEVQWKAGTITKKRKGGVELPIPVSPYVLKFLKRIRPKNDDDYFFPHRFRTGEPISDPSLRKFFQKVCGELKITLPDNTRPVIHSLRHTFATLLKQDGVPDTEIQILMGHADMSTTLRYFSGSSSRARKHVSTLKITRADLTGARAVA